MSDPKANLPGAAELVPIRSDNNTMTVTDVEDDTKQSAPAAPARPVGGAAAGGADVNVTILPVVPSTTAAGADSTPQPLSRPDSGDVPFPDTPADAGDSGGPASPAKSGGDAKAAKPVKEKYRIAEEKDFLRAFHVFDIDKKGINSSQCYTIQNMLNQPSKEPSWQDLEETFTAIDTDRDGSINAEEYQQLLKQLNEIVENSNKSPKTKGSIVFFLMVFLWFFPFLGWFARPGAAADGGCGWNGTARFGFTNFLRATGLPYRFRTRIANEMCIFVLFWITYTLFEAGLIVNFGLCMTQVNFKTYFDDAINPVTGNLTSVDPLAQAGYVARIEPVIGFGLGILASIMLPLMWVVEDTDVLKARYVRCSYPLSV